jgi:hypothetical protein
VDKLHLTRKLVYSSIASLLVYLNHFVWWQYDFPLVKADLEKAGFTLPFDTMCADSYVGIKEMFKRSEDALQLQNKTKMGLS